MGAIPPSSSAKAAPREKMPSFQAVPTSTRMFTFSFNPKPPTTRLQSREQDAPTGGGEKAELGRRGWFLQEKTERIRDLNQRRPRWRI